MAIRKVYKSKDLDHRITLCSADDVAFENKEMRITRKGMYSTWAQIDVKKPSYFASSGAPAVAENRDVYTHCITIHYRPDVEITAAAWIYEERLKSPPRWFKVVDVEEVFEQSQYWDLNCRLVQKGDDIVRPAESSSFIVVPLPEGVKF